MPEGTAQYMDIVRAAMSMLYAMQVWKAKHTYFYEGPIQHPS
jgi:hypothetical protein